MAIQTKPLHEPTRSSRTLRVEEASSLLGRGITLCYRGVEGSLNSVTTNLREIYERFQASLAESFTLTDFCIKGSCVTHLFSGEPFADIDFHATIDLTRIAGLKERFEAGKMVNIKLVETISKIISEKLSSITSASAVSILPTDVLFEEKHIPFSKWGNPFNIHQLHLPEKKPLEKISLLAFSNLLNYVNELVNSAESASKKKIPRSGIKAILDCAWRIIPNFKGKEGKLYNLLLKSIAEVYADNKISIEKTLKLEEVEKINRVLSQLMQAVAALGVSGGAGSSIRKV